MQQENPLRALPSINELLQDERLVALEAEHGHELVLEAARRAIEAAREKVSAGEQPEDIVADALDILEGAAAPRLRRVLNRPVTSSRSNEIHRESEIHHQTQSYKDKFRELCRKYDVEFDERFCWD